MGNFEPYFNAETKNGIFTEVVRKVFEEMPNYTIDMVFGLSNKELQLSFDKRILDGVTNVLDFKEDACLTDPVFRFQDVAVTKAHRKIEINSVSDLKGKKVVTYQGAKVFWGSQFANAVGSANYLEIQEPERQASMLLADRVDVSIGDLFIFMNALQTDTEFEATLEDFTVHEIFPQKFSYMAFRDPQTCKAFNQALRKLKKSGEYELIYLRYLQKFGYQS
ncbi:substrate-binding periplasmic protein [Pseudoalteromonas sp. SSDWG2]|uniref:substrate-binding periplasmic protein n=1 Tax=Pseudoalteromonas sp. SSDWG2 TaxID=3139391 RepID=UPI003BAA9C7B